MESDGGLQSTVTVPDDLESPRAKLVYLYVAANGVVTAEELCADLGVKKGTVLSITGTLRDRGYLERTTDGFELG
ncbi:MarR family transcriptional regulator [Natronolimnohabitans innermongolicus]|uniref:Transcription regulator TrmB N-terminal domain-containing protein n=1 Tax=Natronolimnohabitans innermongolicus JCM 12255 TaxID=1227499 RepID=L9XH64_9EURY|nr:MarR family transcriptional regulator [Natronolimnohabitans innermongolicus]ELY60766.1 hypothetical protein C493_03652 [Natronolimnohabitans innermongolicus JCM 12255]